MTPSLGAFLSSLLLAALVVIIPISAALIFVSKSDKIVRS
jgi:cellulose biosynthesis protein BcsQ